MLWFIHFFARRNSNPTIAIMINVDPTSWAKHVIELKGPEQPPPPPLLSSAKSVGWLLVVGCRLVVGWLVSWPFQSRHGSLEYK